MENRGIDFPHLAQSSRSHEAEHVVVAVVDDVEVLSTIDFDHSCKGKLAGIFTSQVP